MCIKEELGSVNRFSSQETPVVEVSEADVPWSPPDNKYMRCMRAWKTRPSCFSVVGKTARTVNLLEFFDWMDEQELKKRSVAPPGAASSG